MDQLAMSPVMLLKQIGAEEGFSVTFVLLGNDLSMRLVTLKIIYIIFINGYLYFFTDFRTLVQVATVPVFVNFCTGNTSKWAQINAALSALLYLKLRLEK